MDERYRSSVEGSEKALGPGAESALADSAEISGPPASSARMAAASSWQPSPARPSADASRSASESGNGNAQAGHLEQAAAIGSAPEAVVEVGQHPGQDGP